MEKKELIKKLIEAGCYEYKKNRYTKDGTYCLAHGEYERPDYQIRKIHGSDDYYIYGRYYYQIGTYGAKKDGDATDDIYHMAHCATCSW